MSNEAKRLKWSQDISAALSQLGSLQREWNDLDKSIRNRKDRVIYELAEKLEQDGMPLEFILDFMIQGLVKKAPPEDVHISEQYIRRLLKKTKYTLEEDIEESTSQIRNNENSFGFDDNNPSGQSTVQVSGGGDNGNKTTYEPPEPKTKTERQLVKELEDKEEIIKQKEKEIERIQTAFATQEITDIPQLVDNKIGPVKVQNLSRLSDFDRKGFEILTSRFGEAIRRRLVGEGKAKVKFYILAKDRTTGVENLVPVLLTVDMMGKTTELILDEARP
jgi:hypothetical protein